MTIWFRVWTVFLLLGVSFTSCTSFTSVAWAESPPELTAQDKLRQAVTWYKVARATENGMEAHLRAHNLYKEAIQSTGDKEILSRAQRGLIQAEFRLDNAHDTYRTLFDPVWWISGQDRTIEWYDDVYMRALTNAWSAVNAHFEREIDPENHVALVYVTRNSDLPDRLVYSTSSDLQLDVAHRLKLMRDKIIGFAETTPSITGVPDDVMPMNKQWIDTPSVASTDVEAIAEQLNTQGIVLIHAHIDDEIPESAEHMAVARISLTTQFWKAGESQPYATIKSVGVGQDAKSHHWMGGLWLVGMFGLVFGIVVYASEKQYKWHHTLLIAGASFFVGGIWSHLAFAFTADYQVSWDQISLIHETSSIQIPYLPSMRWAWIMGVVLLNGPVFILGWALSNMQNLIFALIPNKSLQWKILLPTMLAGALTWLFMPLVRAHSAGGVWVAVPLTLAIVFTAFRLAPLASYLFQGHRNMKDVAILVMGMMVALSLVFPVGLFNGWHLWVSAALFAMTVRLPEPDATVELEDNGNIDTNAINPFFTFPLSNESEQRITEAMAALSDGVSVQVLDDGVIGQSDMLIELTRRLKTETNKNVQRLLCVQGNNEPFSFVQRILQGRTISSKRTDLSGNILTESVDNIVSSLPGVEFVMGLLGDAASGLSREAIVKDLISALEHRLKKSDVKTIWLIDNAQFMDMGSIEVLQQVLQRGSALQIVWEQHSSQADFFANLEVPHQSIRVEPMSEDTLNEYLATNNVETLPAEIVTEMIRITGGEIEQLRGVLAYLFEQGLLQQSMDGRIQSQINMSAISIQKIVPSSYSQIELERIQRLEAVNPAYKMILECASVCGTTFYAHEIAVALEQSVIEVLENLESMERFFEPSIVFDVPDQPGVFQFGNRLTRDLLYSRLEYEHNNRPREFAVHIHRQILKASKLEYSSIPLFRQQYHAARLLHLHPEFYVRTTLMYLDELERGFAWPEIINVVHQSKESRIHFSDSDRSLITVVYAKALRYSSHFDIDKLRFERPTFERLSIVDTIPIDGHHAAMQLLAVEIDDQIGISSDLFGLLQTWCTISFVGVRPNMPFLQRQQWERFVQYVSEIVPLLSGIEQYYVESFRLTALKLERNIAPELQALVHKIRGLDNSPTQELVLGSVLKEYAAQLWFNTFPDASASLARRQEFWSTTVLVLYKEADRLMLRQNDWKGLATSYGFQGNILTGLEQWDDAIRMLDMDMEIVERHRIVHEKASLNTRLSRLYLQKIGASIQKGLLNQQLEEVMQWFETSEIHEAVGREVADRMGQFWIATQLDTIARERQSLKQQIRDAAV